MAEITFRLKSEAPFQPIDLRELSPDVVVGKSIDEIALIPIWIGNRSSVLGSIFDISGESTSNLSDVALVINGDLPNSRRIGAKMTNGRIVINGRAGLYVGAEMKGGSITVNGDAGDWAGIGLKGGLLEINGNAGDFLGAAYRGSRKGMKGGVIVVKGNAGCDAGAWLDGGTIKILGNAGIDPGIHLIDGTVYVGGNCASRIGASMTGGKVILSGKTENLLAGFQIEEIKDKVKVGEEKISGPFYVFSGDNAESGKGKILIKKDTNPQLASYEIYL